MSIRASCLPAGEGAAKDSGCGCATWRAAQGTPDVTARRNELRNPLTLAKQSDDCVKCYGYLDIETTGISCHYCDLTVVGVAVVRDGRYRFGQLVGGQINADRVLELLDGVDEIYTYNGRRFDLPFIKHRLSLDLQKQFPHTDLMYYCWRQNLKGGLKVVEVRLGIERRLPGMNGYMAVRLWWDYANNNDTAALQKLLAYNQEDVMNLHVLRQKLGVE